MAPSSTNAPALLLLPPPPQPSTRLTLNAAYRAPLTAVLTRLKNELATGSNFSSVLVIAVTCPILTGPVPKAKSVRWKTAQSLLANIYTLISVICAERSIETAGGGSIDTRVLLVDHKHKRLYQRNFDGVFETNCTAVLDLACFASTVYPWRSVFHPSTEAGYELLNVYLTLAEGKQTFLQNQLIAVEGGLSMSTSKSNSPNQEDVSQGYETTILGGTFDHLHPGHKLLLYTTALLNKIPGKDSGKQSVLIVGISGDELLKNKKYAEELQPWDTRVDHILLFLSTIFNSPSSSNTNTIPASTSPHPDERQATFCDGAVLVRCVNIHDPFGPTITEEDIGAIVVSGETRSGGQAINDRRIATGWKPLEVYEIDVLDVRDVADDDDNDATTAEHFAAKISSTAIRQRKVEARNRGSR